MNIRVLLSIIITLNPLYSKASTVGLGNIHNAESFKAYIEKHPSKKSLMESLILKKINTNDQIIKDKYELALKGLLLDDLKPSTYLFKEIANSKSHFIYSKNSQEYISESYFRLSNLNRLKTNFWIKQGLFFNPNYRPPSKVFNPNIISSFELQKNELSNYHFSLETSRIKDLDTHLFLNGARANNLINIHPSALYNLKLYKDGYEELSLEFSGEELSKVKNIKFSKLNFGNCKNPNFISYQGIRVDEIYFSKNCIRKRNLIKSPLAATLTPTFPKNTQEASLIQPNPQDISTYQDKKWFQKPTTWYLIAGTVILTAVIISMNQPSKQQDVIIEPVEL